MRSRIFLVVCLIGFTLSLRADDAATQPTRPVFTGGVIDAAHIADPERSVDYRAGGGGLYLHNNAWHDIDDATRRKALATFAGRPVAVELGFRPIDGWPKLWERAYKPYGVEPTFITANAFDRNNLPTPEQWDTYVAGMRAVGVKESTRIVPTFEYANFGENLPTLDENRLSDRKDFQRIVRAAGGMTLDAPPQYFFEREKAYREWIIDAVRWCNANDLFIAIIVSPHHSGKALPADVKRFLKHLADRDALPAAWISENYHKDVPPESANPVGHEDEPSTSLGVGLQLIRSEVAQRKQP